MLSRHYNIHLGYDGHSISAKMNKNYTKMSGHQFYILLHLIIRFLTTKSCYMYVYFDLRRQKIRNILRDQGGNTKP